MLKLSNILRRTSDNREDQGVFALADVLSAWDTSDYGADPALPFEASVFKNFPLPVGGSEAAGGSEFASEPQSSSTPAIANGGAWRAGASEGPLSAEQSSPAPDLIGSKGPADANVGPGSANDPAVTIANGATAEIDGPSAQSATFAGTTGTLKLEDPQAFTGVISGLAGADAIDLSGFAYGANVKATYSGTRPAAR